MYVPHKSLSLCVSWYTLWVLKPEQAALSGSQSPSLWPKGLINKRVEQLQGMRSHSGRSPRIVSYDIFSLSILSHLHHNFGIKIFRLIFGESTVPTNPVWASDIRLSSSRSRKQPPPWDGSKLEFCGSGCGRSVILRGFRGGGANSLHPLSYQGIRAINVHITICGILPRLFKFSNAISYIFTFSDLWIFLFVSFLCLDEIVLGLSYSNLAILWTLDGEETQVSRCVLVLLNPDPSFIVIICWTVAYWSNKLTFNQ